MKNTATKKALFFGAVISSSLIGITGNANANTIAMDNYGGGGGSVVCDACLGFTGLATTILSPTNADDYAKPGSPASELDAINGLIALIPEPTPAPLTSVSAGGGAGNLFSTDREYFSVKKGEFIWYFQNTKGPINVSVSGAEYSHWTEYGDAVAEVPVPAAAWLFGSGLIALAGLKRRKS